MKPMHKLIAGMMQKTCQKDGIEPPKADPQAIADAILIALEREDLRREAAGLNANMISAKAEYGRTMERVVEFYEMARQGNRE